jgi:hypothetical protein
MSFVDVYGSLLTPFVLKYKEAKNEKGRSAVLKNAADAVSESKDLMEEEAGQIPKDLKAVRELFSLSFVFLLILYMSGRQ